MNKNKTTLALSGLLIALLVALAFLLVSRNQGDTAIINEEEGSGDITFNEDDLQEVETPSIPAPSLTSAVNYNNETIVGEARTIMEDKIAETRATLKANSSLYESWIELGNQYKIVGDFPKAVEAWEYAGLLAPTNAVSFHNLGDIYAYYLNDVGKAEENFLKAIENAPQDAFFYIQASEFYRLVLKDTAKARAILEQGLQKISDSAELQHSLENL